METLYLQFQRNIKRLSSDNNWYGAIPDIISKLENDYAAFTHFIKGNFVFTNKQLNYLSNGKYLHSNRDAHRESTRLQRLLESEQKKNLVLLGTGLGYAIATDIIDDDPDKELGSSLKSLLIIEYNPIFIVGLLCIVNFSNFTQTEVKILFLENVNNNDLELVFSFFQAKNIHDFFVHSHVGALAIDSRKMNLLAARFNRILEKRSINQATIIKFQDLWNRNILLNSKIIFNSEKLSFLLKNTKEKYTNIVIAGAGPSLAQSCADLRKHREKYLLIAVDTAYLPLIKQNIIPDLVLASDPQWLNHYFVLSNKVEESIWLLDPVVHYNITHYLHHKKARIFFWDNPFALDELLRSIQGNRGEIQHGGSVSTNAFDLAVQLSPKNLLLVGQDLSFYDKMAHTKGAILESMVYHNNTRYRTMENHNYKQLGALPKIPVRSIDSTKETFATNNLFTNAKLQVFLEWFSAQSVTIRHKGKINLLNASAGGARIPGIPECNLDIFFSNLKTSNHKLNDILPKQNFSTTDLEENLTQLKTHRKNFIKIKDLLKENIFLSKSCLNKVDEQKMRKLDENDLSLKNLTTESKVVSLGAQKDIILISEQTQELKPLQHSLILYTALHRSVTKLLMKF